MYGDINSEICEFMEVEITGKRKKDQPRELWEDSISRYVSTKVQIISAQGKGAQGMRLRINTVCTF